MYSPELYLLKILSTKSIQREMYENGHYILLVTATGNKITRRAQENSITEQEMSSYQLKIDPTDE